MKQLLLLCLFCIGLSTHAQRVHFGATAGVNLNQKTTFSDSKVGFHAGVKAEIGLDSWAKGLYADASLIFTRKAFESDTYIHSNGVITDPTSAQWSDLYHSNTYSLELPIYIGYKYSINSNWKLFGAAGVYGSLGLSGSLKKNEEGLNAAGRELVVGTDSKVEDNAFKNSLSRTDYGIGLKIGTEFHNHYQLSLGYQFGLKDINKFDSRNWRNRTITASLSYLF